MKFVSSVTLSWRTDRPDLEPEGAPAAALVPELDHRQMDPLELGQAPLASERLASEQWVQVQLALVLVPEGQGLQMGLHSQARQVPAQVPRDRQKDLLQLEPALENRTAHPLLEPALVQVLLDRQKDLLQPVLV